ncbi:MAG: S8 family serine peptidase [Burkholderiaceae bacterium]
MSRGCFVQLLGLLLTAILVSGCVAPPVDSNNTQRSQVNFKMGAATQDREPRMVIVTMADEKHSELVGAGEVAASKVNLPRRYRALLDRWERDFGMTRRADWPLSELGVRCMVFEIDDQQDMLSVLASLSREPIVETAQQVQSFKTADGAYNDPYRNLQHGLTSMEVERSHRWSTGKGVTVAVIDTGLDASHRELVEKVTMKRNLVDGDLNDFGQDIHGTAVAGVIAARANNAIGMVGVAPDAAVMAMKACWQIKADSDAAICNSFTLAKALNASIASKADVINLSLAGPVDPLLSRLVRRAIQKSIIVVGAVDSGKPGSFPASTQGVVAASIPSEWARNTNLDGAGLHLAPGQQVLSIRPGNEFDTFSGSSISAAHVSGLAALAKQLKPDLDSGSFAQILRDTASQKSGESNACALISWLLPESSGNCIGT